MNINLKKLNFSRRTFIKNFLALAGVSSIGTALTSCSRKSSKNIKIGLMLPYTGTYAKLGKAIENGFKMALAKNGELDPESIDFYQVDDESNPAKAVDNANKLIVKDKVDILIGTVHSGVVMGMLKIARNSDALMLIPNAGAGAATGSQCAKNIFRTSFTNWQPTYPLGKILMEKGHKKAIFITWKYAAGSEARAGFEEGYIKFGGELINTLYVPFPNVEFQALLTKISAVKPDAVVCFFAGGGAVKFVKDYAASGLKDKIPLFGSGFLTEGVLPAQGAAAEGLMTTLHYADSLQNETNKSFRTKYYEKYGKLADVYAVQGYDTGLVLSQSLNKVDGDFKDRSGMIRAIEGMSVDSPRGQWTMSKAHNPIQNIYLRQVINNDNKVLKTAWDALEDPATGCGLI